MGPDSEASERLKKHQLTPGKINGVPLQGQGWIFITAQCAEIDT